MSKKKTKEDEERTYNYVKLAIATQVIIEMQAELRNTNVFNGKAKNAALVIRKQASHDIEKDIIGIYERDSDTANSLISGIETVASQLATLDVKRIANMSLIIKRIEDQNCMLIDRGYYEELEKIKEKYNKLKK